MNLPDRWEYGSEFHFLRESSKLAPRAPWDERAVFAGSGRDAFRALISFGMAERGWTRFWIPSYFCQEVVSCIIATGIELRLYRCGPLDDSLSQHVHELERGDVVLRANFFGLRGSSPSDGVSESAAEIVEDHTHDPFSDWAHHSSADWCVASLRKTLPVPDGGVLWSPRGHTLPRAPEVTDERKKASARKLLAMFLKAVYLDGDHASKDDFRELAIGGEELIAEGDASGMLNWSRELLAGFPVDAWRARRRNNHRAMSEALSGRDWLTVLQPDSADTACPFSAILHLDSHERREHIRKQLIASNVYPAVLWPLEEPAAEGIPAEHVDLSRRLLSIHCDMRYNVRDLEYVCSLVNRFGEEFGS